MINLEAVDTEVAQSIGVSIVMPCLNEAKWLPLCIQNAREALDLLYRELNLNGEIIVADNGSSDGSQLAARACGARVVEVRKRGYGAALQHGLSSANGRYLVMGDADGSYDFRESVEMVRQLVKGADVCIGSRFKGTIEPEAMPWKNRYIGNPALTSVLNLFFRTDISDAHCGLRAFTKESFEKLNLSGNGMEFASEIIIKAALKKLKIVEVPVSLRKDLRDRPPHLRPWRDGWRHLRYLLMLSGWVFAVPSFFTMAISLFIFAFATVATFSGKAGTTPIGNYWVILAGSMFGLSHTSGILAAAVHLFACKQGYRKLSAFEATIFNRLSLEVMLLVGSAIFMSGMIILGFVVSYWSDHNFVAIGNVLPAVAGTSLLVVGAQNILGGFLFAIISGNEARLIEKIPSQSRLDNHEREATQEQEKRSRHA